MSRVPQHITQVHVAPHFERSLRNLPLPIRQLSVEKDLIFRENPFNPILRTHSLKGQLKGLWAYSIDRHHRILFEFIKPHEVLYHDIGSHSIYR